MLLHVPVSRDNGIRSCHSAVGEGMSSKGPILSAVLLFLLLLLWACGGGGNAATEPPPKRAESLIGYGVVNFWHEVEPVSYSRALCNAGLTLTEIEYVPWTGEKQVECPGKYGGGQSYTTFPDRAERLIRENRRCEIATLVNVVNWNSCALRTRDDQWFRDRMGELLAIGPELVLLSPVSEPWNASDPEGKALRWTRIARGLWTGGFVLPGNRAQARPYWSGIPHDFVDLHHCSDDSVRAGLRNPDARLLHNTDCSPVVNPGPERAAGFTRYALDNRTNLLVYGFWDREPDAAVIQAMGAEVVR